MEFLVVCLVALAVSGLTLFSGFGLGTLLMPAFALFFPLEVAIAATAVVHLANNIFKVILMGRKADWGVVLRFSLPGAMAALGGAWLLTALSGMEPLVTYSIGDLVRQITPVKILVGLLVIGFAFLEVLPRFASLAFERKWLPLGGALSGFFGGLSGHQGALRSAFLLRCGLEKEAFVGTGVVSAVVVDCVRLVVYGVTLSWTGLGFSAGGIGWLVVAASGAAFVGAFLGTRLLKKITIQTVQRIIAVMLFVLGAGMISGLV